MPQMQLDFDGLLQLVANNLYSEKKVFIRELIQNGHDAIMRRAAYDPSFSREQGRIDILTDLTSEPARIIFRDNGTGMSHRDLDEYLSSIGASGTREASTEVEGVIGQFGIGFLSGFVVAARLEVRTRHWEEADPAGGWLWRNQGKRDYTVEPCEVKHPGTEVTVFLQSAEDRGLLQDEAVRRVIYQYADMLTIPIHLNFSQEPVNRRVMPWEREGLSYEERRVECFFYLERTVPDRVLEVIPVKEEGEVNVSGLLYITRLRVIGQDAPRTIRVFQKRMFLCENTPEILPVWATFINGVVNTPDLVPTAARDNFRRDDAFNRLRNRLAECIIRHFEQLRDKDPDRLSEILTFHNLAIKSACYYYEPFFEKFGHLLEWRVNAKSPAAVNARHRGGRHAWLDEEEGRRAWLTLPEIVAALPSSAGDGPKRLSCFTTHSSANQFFEMADAAGSTVVDASYWFEDNLLQTWAKSQDNLRLVYVDREDDPAVFKDIDEEADRAVRDLANYMSLLIRPGGTGRVRVEARRFEPASLPAVLKVKELGAGSMKAREVLNDPNAASDLRKMAEDMLRLARNAEMRMTINAANPLIRELASLDDFDDPEVNDLMMGVYNDAILYNHELMTPMNARLFHEQFGRLLKRNIEFFRQREDMAKERERLAAEAQRRRPVQSSRRHLVAFLITPFAAQFGAVREAVRRVVEEKLGSEMRTAKDLTYADVISGNVRAHIQDADFFVADVTGANPNVMHELGAVYYGRPDCPTLLIAAAGEAGQPPNLPADLQGHVAATYTPGGDVERMAEELEQEFGKHHLLRALLARPDREAYVSPEMLRQLLVPIDLGDSIFESLSQRFATVSAWEKATPEQVRRSLGPHSDLAEFVLARIRKGLPR